MDLNFKELLAHLKNRAGNTVVVASLLLLVAACTKEVKIRLPSDPKRPVLNSMIVDDSLVLVRLTWSVPPEFPSGTAYPVIENATVKLFADIALIETLENVMVNNTLYYRSRQRIKGIKNYKVTAVIPGWDSEISGNVNMPARPVIAAPAFTTGTDSYQNTIYYINCTIKDDANTQNFYRLRIYPYNGSPLTKTDMMSFVISNLKTDGGGIFDDFKDEEQSRQRIFDDELFNGKAFTLNIKSRWGGRVDSLRIELAAISESAYRYYKSAERQDLAKDDPLYKPVPVYNNITNGMGIVGAFNIAAKVSKKE